MKFSLRYPPFWLIGIAIFLPPLQMRAIEVERIVEKARTRCECIDSQDHFLGRCALYFSHMQKSLLGAQPVIEFQCSEGYLFVYRSSLNGTDTYIARARPTLKLPSTHLVMVDLDSSEPVRESLRGRHWEWH